MKTTENRNHTDSGTVIDTSNMTAAERAALELTEAARETTLGRRTLAGSLFLGKPDLALIDPFPAQSLEDRDQGDAFLDRLRAFLEKNVDADEIDRSGEIPDEVIAGLAQLGAFGIKIPTEYGGLGLSQTNYSRSAMLLGGFCGNIAALVSAHQSIGVPQPLILFGTEQQKKKYLPRCARGEISAFALTEGRVGSDPAKIQTTAELSEDGESWVINGEKLWCTNGLKAGMLVVMARTPSPEGDKRVRTTAFIVETDTPGLEFTHRCRFMGLRALYNSVVTFDNVRVPKENIILAEGKGLKVALTTLNTGRLTLPAACSGLARRCLEIALDWSSVRVQWGSPIGRHAAIADKLSRIAAETFATEAMVLYTSALVDRDKKADIRIEAAMAKLFGSESGWRTADETMQIRGGRGYETAQSLAARGDEPLPVERYLRDARINTIFEGSSEIMRLIIAREALDPHLRVGAAVLNSTLSWKTRLRAAWGAALFYARWYPAQWLPTLSCGAARGTHPALARELRRVRATSRRLARALFHSIMRYGPKLEKKQLQLGRLVDIGVDLFAITATCTRAAHLLREGCFEKEIAKDPDELLKLVDFFCRSARTRIERNFHALRHNADRQSYSLAKSLLPE
ncbi:MAG: acyl-CoA dehydrogenase family protein [Verrucomicrobiales bacterium]